MSEDVLDSIIIHSSVYGDINVSSTQIYEFPQGIVGFDNLKRFALLPYADSNLFTLQAFSDEIGLMLIPAMLTEQVLEFELDDSTVEELQTSSVDDLVVFYVIRVIDGNPYINQKAPILLSLETNKGCQYIVQNDAIPVRVPLVLKGE